jgi:hypothetical protein
MNKTEKALRMAIAVLTTGKAELEAREACKAALSDAVTLPDVAMALEERDKLGFTVVEVIGKLDEINEQVEEITLHDFNYFAIPAELWHELQDSLEQMPQRADLFTQLKFTLHDGWVSDPDTIPAQLIEVTRQAIRIEFGDDGTDGYYKRILAKIFKAMLQAAPTYEKEKG